jgi:hypothetical protein
VIVESEKFRMKMLLTYLWYLTKYKRKWPIQDKLSNGNSWNKSGEHC